MSEKSEFVVIEADYLQELEEALLDYVMRYGLTCRARKPLNASGSNMLACNKAEIPKKSAAASLPDLRKSELRLWEEFSKFARLRAH
ncbi:hypothetical protein [Puniceibacterium sediminis]|uniref:Uncharacterized protein n=1 Tax=Puniceibacterium sediminis TaxID=1608407 RepID=A0A238XMB9_9RHOB|nr:hypothetical protein [Puniceibacterium sediminis]SNR59494.1 hypothetical protein SAMN06265370_1123 [Puniceibacterium sediminis]